MSGQLIKESLKPNSKVAVIGAGISGLSFTYFLSKLRPDLKFTIFEKTQRHGGWIHTVTDDETKPGMKYEKGPRTLRGVSDGTLVILDMLLKLGFKDDVYAVYKKSLGNEKYLLSNVKNSEDDYLVKVPNDAKSLLKFLMSPLSKKIITSTVREPFRKLKTSDEDESIGSFISRRFDKAINDNIASAMIHGIYGGDSNKLSIKALMPSVYNVEKESSLVQYGIESFKKSRTQAKAEANEEQEKPKVEISEELLNYQTLFGKPMIPFENMKKFLKNFPMILFKDKGLSIITDLLRNELDKNPQVEILFEQEDLKITPVEEGVLINGKQQFDHVRSTVSSLELAKMVSQETEFQSLLGKLNFVDMIVVNLFVKNTKLYKEGFGYLVPQSVSPHKHYLLGCIFDSSIEKNSVPLLLNNRHLVKLINYPEVDQKDIDSMIKFKDDLPDENLVKVTLMFGGHYIKENPEIWTQSPRQFKKIINSLIQEQFHLDAEDFVITKIKDCIPQFEVGYLESKKEVQRSMHDEFKNTLSLGGMSFNSYNKVGVPDVFMDSLRQAIAFR